MTNIPPTWLLTKLVDYIPSVPTGVKSYIGKRKYYSTGSISGKNYLPEGEYEFHNRPSRANRVAKAGDVFQARMKGTDKALIIQETLSEQLFSTGFLQIRPIKDTYSNRLLCYFIRSDFFLKQRDKFATGSTQVALTDSKAAKLELIVPPLSEQRRIVAKLEKLLQKVDACTERLDKIPTILKRFRQSVLAAACSGRLTVNWREEGQNVLSAKNISERIQKKRLDSANTPVQKKKIKEIYSYQEQEDSDSLPENWRYVALDKLCESFQYGTSKKSMKSGKIPVLRMGNLQNGEIDWSDLAYTSDDNEIEKYKLNLGDVLFNRTNSPELVGKTSIYRGNHPAIFAGYLIKINNFEELDSEYLNYCLNSAYAKVFFLRVKTDGVSQSNINAKKLGKFEVPFCSLEEQQEIVHRVEALFKIADQIEERYNKARTYVDKLTQSILAKAFRGELVPQDTDDEPASELLKRIKEEQAKKEGKIKTGSMKRKKKR